MRMLMGSRWLLFFLLIITCVLITSARRGGGGGSRGGSRGSSSRGSSSRGSSSRTTYERSRSNSGNTRTDTRPKPPPPPPPPPPPKPQPKPSAPEVVRQPAVNPNFRESNPYQGSANSQPAYNPNYSPGANQKPPPYSPRENPPPYSPNQGVPPPPYSPHGSSNVRQPYPGEAPPSYPGGVSGANYPRQPGMSGGNYPQPGGVPGANYPRQPGMPSGNYPQQGGVPGANYPRQPGMPSGNYPQQGGANYPRQPGTFGQPGVGIPAANYPRQTYTAGSLGSNVWQPQSGRPAPAYMNYGGLPTGSNMYSKPEKKKGFLGSLMSMGSHKPKKNKYFGSQPSPYGMGNMGGMGHMGGMGGMGGGFMGKHGSKAAMYTILPYMAARKMPKFSRPSFGYYPIFYHSPFHHHHHHYYGHYGGHTHYDIYNSEYVGKCNRPLSPDHGKVVCNSTSGEVACDVSCEEGYNFPDNTTSKDNKCWHVTGVWKPMKNFPACQPVCNRTCLNGGTCIGPNVCGCPPEYRGLQCEFYFLKCDIRKLANGAKIKWVCTHSKNETSCKIKCKDSLQFATPIEDVYKCSPDGVWSPNVIPECVSTESAANSTDVTTLGIDVTTPANEVTTNEPEAITPESSKRK